MLALTMVPEPGWHGYWLNGGAAGYALQDVRWDVPVGVQIGDAQFPVPAAKTLFGMVNHVYETPYAILFPVIFPKSLSPDTPITITMSLRWLACDPKVCVPESGTFSVYLKSGIAKSAQNPKFAKFRQALPRPLDRAGAFQRISTGKAARIRFSIPLPATVRLNAPHLFIAENDVVNPNATQIFARDGDRLLVETAAASPVGSTPEPGQLQAVLRFDDQKDAAANGVALGFVSGNVPDPTNTGVQLAATTATPDWSWAMLFAALGGAVVGGLLLNLMPCVFPILSLKAIGLTRMGQENAAARRDGWAYLAGAVAMALLLGAMLLTLRLAGQQLGWAFQLQHPISILLLIVLFVAMTANLAGLFEIRGFGGGDTLAGQSGAAGSFWTGALAAFVATPCSGPFLGAALGATLVLPPWASLMIFGGLGFGLAFPFVAIAYSARLRRFLPAPGVWMVRFRRWMALPMALTTVALIWLFVRQVGLEQAGIGLVVAGITGVLCWCAGKAQRAGKNAVGIAALAVLFVPMALLLKDWHPPVATAVNSAIAGAKPYGVAALAAARAANRPVFIDATADWCVTCKVNEATAINRAETARAFADANVQMLVADWTNGDPAITAMLAAQGRNSVPLYLWYAPGADMPEILPQILTPDMLVTRAKAAR